MPNLNFRAYITRIAPPTVDTSPDDTRAITAHVAGTLRTMAEQIERGGLSGCWQNVAGIPANDGYPAAQYALKWEYPHNTKAENGPPCLPSVREPATDPQAAPAVALNLEPSAQFLRDVLCTAVEGGSNYWARFKVLNRVQGEHVEEYDRVRVTEYGDDDKPQSRHDIGLPELAEGVRRVLAGNMGTGADHENVAASYRAELFQALISEPGGDAGQVDANLADIVLQAAALGHIVYG